MRTTTSICKLSLLLCGYLFLGQAVATENHHPNHIAVAAGGALHGSESSGYLGIDYAYRFQNKFAAAIFYELVDGDFNLEAFGISGGYIFDNGFKVGTGPGIERKLKDNKTLWLWHVTAAYDWQINNWSIGPVASYDFIENNSNTVYVGMAIGYGF